MRRFTALVGASLIVSIAGCSAAEEDESVERSLDPYTECKPANGNCAGASAPTCGPTQFTGTATRTHRTVAVFAARSEAYNACVAASPSCNYDCAAAWFTTVSGQCSSPYAASWTCVVTIEARPR